MLRPPRLLPLSVRRNPARALRETVVLAILFTAPWLAAPPCLPQPEVRVTSAPDLPYEPDLAGWGENVVAVWARGVWESQSNYAYSTCDRSS